ncbi:lipopolysaccharide biosynthesis protein [Proteinivorax hydrogeniformans]|uniref:Lipopolysaccharide biosynthesis protein n=1 Tax=Proteinivorax hydrogeniformans TaxID=1826727 RepID=A0AAU8HWV9_9FIRM
MNKQASLKNKTISGMIWSFSERISTQIVQLIVQVVLARLLVPEDFGLLGMIMVFIALSQTFVDNGFTKGLVREHNSTEEDYSTVFFFNLAAAIALYITLFFSAEGISIFFEEPQLVSLIRVIGVVLVINAFGLIQRTILIKKMNFKTETKINLASSLSAGVIAIFLALRGAGVWALVFQKIFMQFFQALLLTFSNRWLPSLVFNVESFKRFFSFGWKLFASSLIGNLYKEINQVIIGRMFLATDLGFYTNAKKLKDTAANSITQSVQKVSYPVLSSLQDDPTLLKKGYQKIIKNAVYITFPFMLGLMAIAPTMIPLFLGEQWASSIGYFQILCLAGALYPLHAINLNILQVKGRTDLFLKFEIVKKVVGLTLIVVSVVLELGIEGLLWATVINSYISFFINSSNSKELANYSSLEQLKDIGKTAFNSILMTIGVYIIGTNVLPFGYFLTLIIQVCSGVALYVTLSLLFKVEEFTTILNIIKPLVVRVLKRGHSNFKIFK